jgi:polar amino acid transport system substrate-binding protein
MRNKYNPHTWLVIALAIACSVLLIFTLFKEKNPAACATADTLIVGTNAEFPPYTFMDNNTIVGFDIDIMTEVAKRLSKKIEWRDMPFDALIPAAQLGTIHMIAAGMTPTPQRAQRLLFTKPYTGGNPLLIIALAGSHITSVADLVGKDVLVNEGFIADDYMSSKAGVRLHRLPTVAESFLALTSNRADAYVLSKQSAQPFLAKYGTARFTIVEIPQTAETTALTISPRYPDLLTQVQQVLDLMATDGTLATIKQKWNIYD